MLTTTGVTCTGLPTNPNAGKRRDDGAALFLAILLMTALISFGVAYLEVSAGQMEVRDAELAKVKAQALAEAGIAHAHSKLVLDPTFNGALSETLGDGGYDVAIRSISGGVEISSVGGDEHVGAGYRSILSQRNTPNLNGPFLIGGSATFTSCGFGWGGKMGYGDKLNRVASVVLGQSALVTGTDVPSIVIDHAAAQSVADTSWTIASGTLDEISPGVLQVTDGDYGGVCYCDGDLDIVGDVTFQGTLIVAGNLTVHDGAKVVIQRHRHPSVLLVGGELTFRDVQTLVVAGTVYCQGASHFEQINWLEGLGTIVTNSDISFEHTNGGWEFDPSVNHHDSIAVTGAPTTPTFQEMARVPFVAEASSNLVRGGDTRGAVTPEGAAASAQSGSMFEGLMSAFGSGGSGW